MEAKDVIEKIKSRIEAGKVVHYQFGVDIDNCYTNFEDLYLAIQALEKQIPKKPAEPHGDWLNKRCPSCDYIISRSEEGLYNYCKKCGQALDWEEE